MPKISTLPKKYIYGRVSKSRQNVLNQVVELKRLYPDAEVHRESGSAFRGRLPVLDALLKKLRTGDTLIIWSIDRLGRRVSDLTALFEFFNNKGITLISKREGIDLSTATGKMIAHIFSALAQVESEIRSERIKAAFDRMKKKDPSIRFGPQPGLKPTLRMIKSQEERKGEKRPTRKELIEGFPKTVIDLYKAGLSYAKITDIMGHRTETKVSKTTIFNYVKRYKKTGEIEVPIVQDEL